MRSTAVLAVLLVVLAGGAPAVGAASAAAPASGGAAPAAGPTAPALPDGVVTRQTANCSFPVAVTDSTGTKVTVDARPERVTTLGASAAQTMWTIDAREQVVGVTASAGYLGGSDSRTNVSSTGFGPSVERVVGTNPDLVVAANIVSPETVSALREAGVTVYRAPMATSIDDVRAKTTTIGRLTGNCGGAAAANAWTTANVAAAENATADRDRPRALYPLGGGFVANTGTFISAMIRAAGAENALAGANVTGAYPEVSDEVILELAPEYLVITGPSNVTTREPYASTPAGRENDTVRVNANYLNQPAPRSVVYAVRNLTTGFHPDADPAFVDRAAFDAANATTDGTATESGTATERGVGATPTGTTTPGADPTTVDGGTTPANETATERTAVAGDGATPTTTESSSPGFGAGAAALALLASALVARRVR